MSWRTWDETAPNHDHSQRALGQERKRINSGDAILPVRRRLEIEERIMESTRLRRAEGDNASGATIERVILLRHSRTV